MYYSYNNQYPISFDQIPERIRLSSGLTKTNKSTFTEEELLDAGYKKVDLSLPEINVYNEKISWTGTEWLVEELTEQEKEQIEISKWAEIRTSRDKMIESTIWRVQRYESEVRLGITPTDDIVSLDRYIQELRDITKQSDPFNIVWPNLDETNL